MTEAGRIHKRYKHERWFLAIAAGSILIALIFLIGLAVSTLAEGWRGFLHAEIYIEDISLDPAIIGKDGGRSALAYQKLIKKHLLLKFPESQSRAERKLIRELISASGGIKLREKIQKDPGAIGRQISVWLPAGATAEAFFKNAVDAETLRRQQISDQHIEYLQELRDNKQTRISFNTGFFINADSRNAEMAGIGGALLGSLYSLFLAFCISFPAGVLTAVYLEFFARDGPLYNKWLDLVEININNLAAVPSVVFGLLGLSVFINIFELPRSSPLVGGLVLSLMTLPTIIIASRAALKAVPPVLLSAALSLGATRIQAVFHHILPAAMPSILTGAIIGMAQALGETAPLLMIGMVAFIADAPAGITDAATALPVQIFLWADSPERGFSERTAAAIIVLIGFLIIMNASAVLLRRKLEKKW